LIVAVASPDKDAFTDVGCDATCVDGVTAFDAGDKADVPCLFVADTLNVYVAPFVKPTHVIAVRVVVIVCVGGCVVTVSVVCV
jgi:hypothetical protein